MDKKNVSIKLISSQSDGESREETELFSRGSYEKTDLGYRISYEETEATGFEGSVTTLETFGNVKVVMDRRGAVTSNLVIEKGVKHHCIYGTPYGAFTVGVDSRSISSTLGDEGGSLKLHYVIDVNSSYVGDFEINVDVKPIYS
ncbi:MAG: DUF1934 domain-containing protein [Ruminococcus sp.]|nr:DUF1934 domain-containing protein [Ruminococcus sp.]